MRKEAAISSGPTCKVLQVHCQQIQYINGCKWVVKNSTSNKQEKGPPFFFMKCSMNVVSPHRSMVVHVHHPFLGKKNN